MLSKITIIILIALTYGNISYAGSSCNSNDKIDAKIFKDASEASINLIKFLNKTPNLKVAIIARVGSDSSKYGIKYTHAAYVVKNKSNWEVIHLLNSCGTDTSAIYNQGIMNFYLDDLYTMETLIAIPNEELQNNLLKILNSRKIIDLHHSRYNMIANPFDTKFQNSNQWLLEVLTSAIAENPIENRNHAQEFLKSTNFIPHQIPISAIERVGAGLRANVTFADHSAEESKSGKYAVVTVDSIVSYLKKLNMLTMSYDLAN